MERWIVKLIVLNIIFFSAFGMTLLPMKVSTYFHRQGQRGQRIISHMMCLGGGVFFAMYMLQMTPASLDIVQTYIIEPYNINFPLAEFVIGCGFLIMLLSEITFDGLEKRRKKIPKKRTRNQDLPHELLPYHNPITSIELPPELSSPDEVFTDTPDNNKESGSVNPMRNEERRCTGFAGTEQSDQVQLKVNRRPNTLPSLLNKDFYKAGRNQLKLKDSLKSPMIPLMSVSSNDGLSPLLSISSNECLTPLITIGIKAGLAPLLCIGFSGHLHQQFSITSETTTDDSPQNDEAAETGNLSTHVHASRSLVLLFALSLHHVFEGLSIGLKHSKVAVWNMCIAIVSHEVIIAFSLGMQLVHTFHSKTKITIAAFICSIMSPLGVAIGMAILETGGHDDPRVQIANGLLQSLATGIFIYVTFFEILQDELGHNKANFAKVMWICAGFLLLSSLGLIAPNDDDMEEDNGFASANSTDTLYNGTYTTSK